MFRRSLSLSLIFSLVCFLLILMMAVSLDVWIRQKMPEMRPVSVGLMGLMAAWLPISLYFQIRRRVLTPLRQLRQKFNRAGKDRIEMMTPLSTKDEISDVVAGYNQMVLTLSAEREERQRFERERQLQAQLVALGTQADGLVHELASPLSTLSTLAKLAAEGDREAALRLSAEAKSMGERLRRFMALFREKESASTHIRPIRLDSLILERIKMAQRDSVTFQFVPPAEPLEILSDEVLLSEILDNLIRNAARHAKSKVVVEEDKTDGEVCVTVSDDGVGIPPQHAEKMFRPFFTTSEGGHGLGLFVSKLWVQALGGRLELAAARHSTLGGASFRVILPAKINL